jgi:hypothetical protein
MKATTAAAMSRFLGIWGLIAGGLSAADHFVAPGGDDANPGTIERPFASLARAQRSVSPGDTVFLRGGNYRMKESDIAQRDGFLASIMLLEKSGTNGRPIRYQAFGDERPVFDCSQVKPAGLRISAIRVRASWVHLKGIAITGVQVTHTGHTQSICVENLGDHNVFEQLQMHDGQAIGLFISRGSHNLVLNCDAWNNHDFTSGNQRGGNTDGFGCHVARGGAGNVFRGCRAWLNSDDGFDCISTGSAVVFENCWAFRNGLSAEGKRLGDGNGFKAGGYGIEPNARFPDPVPRHRVMHCIAVGNPSSGFYANHHPGGIDFIGNAAISNGTNFNFLGRSADAKQDIPGHGHRIIDNFSLNGGREITNIDEARCDMSGNRFDPRTRKQKKARPPVFDEASLSAPRKSDGSLPDITIPGLDARRISLLTGAASAKDG